MYWLHFWMKGQLISLWVQLTLFDVVFCGKRKANETNWHKHEVFKMIRVNEKVKTKLVRFCFFFHKNMIDFPCCHFVLILPSWNKNKKKNYINVNPVYIFSVFRITIRSRPLANIHDSVNFMRWRKRGTSLALLRVLWTLSSTGKGEPQV